MSVKPQLEAAISRGFSRVVRGELLDIQKCGHNADNSGASHAHEEDGHQNVREKGHQEVKHMFYVTPLHWVRMIGE